MTEQQRIFITGANGFIGSHLVKRLLEYNYEIGFLRRGNSDISQFKNISENLKMFIGDIRDSTAVTRILSDFSPEMVIHLATYYRVEHVPDDVAPMIDTNVKGTLNLLESAKNSGVKFFINTSSCAVYRQSNARLKETDPVSPQNLYALTKLHAEEACYFYSDYFGLDSVSLRIFPPFGPGDHERRLIPYVINSILNGNMPDLTTGRQMWDFVFVEDIVDAYCAVIRKSSDIKGHEPFNIGTGAPVSVKEMVLEILRQMKVKGEPCWGAIPHRKNEVWYNSADLNKTETILGWSPKISLKEGIERTIRSIMDSRKSITV
jgi:nucleoside-diphosphate-sugar epimerase